MQLRLFDIMFISCACFHLLEALETCMANCFQKLICGYFLKSMQFWGKNQKMIWKRVAQKWIWHRKLSVFEVFIIFVPNTRWSYITSLVFVFLCIFTPLSESYPCCLVSIKASGRDLLTHDGELGEHHEVYRTSH